MSKCKISGKVLAIQLGREQTQIVLLNGSEILHGASVPTPAGAVDDGVIRNPDALRETLKTALKAPEFKRVHQAVFSLCTSQVITETVTVPELPAAKLEKLLRANADMYFPVDTQDYQLVWEVIGPKGSDGMKELAVQLWAVPIAMLTQYYSVANACGLSVAAIDYCGHSVATAAGASFARSGKAAKAKKKLDLNADISFGSKKKAQPEEPAQEAPAAETRRNPDTDLHLLLDKDLLGMTFVQNGQVVLQRLVRCGSHPSYQFGELSMMLEYFRSLDIGRGSTIRGIVSGGYAGDRQMVSDLEDMLGIDVKAFNTDYDLGLVLCVGAARTGLDFGMPNLNSPGKARKQVQSQIWQYGLVLAGALAVLAVVLMTLTSRLSWNSEVQSLENTKQLLTIQAQKTAGFADNYYEYENLYDAYDSDWDTIFFNLQAYNDNLVLVMDELEAILPENSSVTNMQIASNGLNVIFACEDKEEAAYLIMALREMQYADLITVSDLSGGGSGAATTYGSGTTGEKAPTEGSAVSGLLDGVTKDDLLALAASLSDEEIATLESVYGKQPSTTNKKLSDLVNDETRDELFEKRGAALETMLTSNPFALNHFYDILMADFNKGADTVLWWYIIDDWIRWTNDGTLSGDLSDPAVMMDLMNKLIEVLIADEETLAATEAMMCAEYEEGLLCSDTEMELNYIHYLEVQMELREEEDYPYLNTTKLATHMLLYGGVRTGNSSLDAKLNALLGGSGTTGPTDPTGPSETEPEETEPEETVPTVPTVPTIPEETEPEETKPEETEPSQTNPTVPEETSPYTDAEVEQYIKAYLTGRGSSGNETFDDQFNRYLTETTSGSEAVDKQIDACISSGAVDTEMVTLLYKYIYFGQSTGIPAMDAVVQRYTEAETTGNPVLDALIASYKLEFPDKGETNPDETRPGGSEDELPPYITNAIDDLFQYYLQNGTTDLEQADVLIEQFLTEGTTGYDALDNAIEVCIENGFADAEIKYLLDKYEEEGGSGVDVIDTVIEKYKTEDSTGVAVLDTLFNTYYGSKDDPTKPTNPTDPTDPADPTDPTDPEETEPDEEEQLMALLGQYLKLYLTEGTTGDETYDLLIESYLTTGTTGAEELDQMIEDYIRSGAADELLEDMIANYILNGTTDNETVDGLIDKYMSEGTTGIPALDDFIAKYLGNSNTGISGQYLKLYFTYGTTGISDKDDLIESYITTGTTGNEEYDGILNTYVSQGNVDGELQNLLYMYLYKRTSLNGYDALLTMFDNYFNEGGTGSAELDERIKVNLKALAEYALQNAGSASGSSGNKTSGGGNKAAVTDTRVYFAAVLGYNDELRNAELDRKGLSYEDKIEKLEVEE